MTIIGLVGRIGAGKSTVARRFAEHGATVVDADRFTYTAPNSVPALTGTYSQSGTAVSVSINSHGFTTGDQVLMDITSGTGVDGTYEVTVSNANAFTYTAGTSLTTSGNCTANAIVNCTVVHQANYSPSTVEIAAALRTALATALGGGFTVTNGAGQYVVRITKNDGTDYTLSSTDTKTGLASVAIGAGL